MNRTAAAQLKSTGAGPPPPESKFKRGKASSFMAAKPNIEERHQIISQNNGTQYVFSKTH